MSVATQTVRRARVDLGEPLALLVADFERRVLHAERIEDVLLHVAPSFWPVTFSTALPAKSMPIPYSHFSPGSKSNGAVSAAFAQEMIAGVPVFSR